MKDNQLFGSTRFRLAIWYASVMACIMGICGLGVYQVVAHAYRRTIDQGLQAVTGVVAKQIEPVLQRPEQLRQVANHLSLKLCLTKTDCIPSTEAAQLPEIIRPSLVKVPDPINYYIRLLDSTGRPIIVMGLQVDQLPSTSGKAQWQTLTDHQGIHYRQVSLPLQKIKNQPGGYVQVGRSLQDLDQNLAALRWTLLLGCAIALLLVAWSSWWLAGLAMQPIYHSYQQMQQFTADAAHEFRTPLAAMQATIESTLRFQTKPDSTLDAPEGALAVLQRQTLRLSELVKDLLLLTRIDQHKRTGERLPCCLNDLISDLMEELAFLAVKEEVELSMQLQVPDTVYVLGDEEQLYRLVCNLINNAIQATPAGGKVTVSLNKDEQSAITRVQDTGLGIAPAEQRRIFERFYRVEQDRSRHTGGSGLGLPIALAIAHAHHGTIQVQSKVGEGSTFTLRLPLE